VDEDVVAKFSLSARRFVTVHNGFDLSTVTETKFATKVYPRFGDVIKEFRKKQPGIVFVQIGASTSVVIEEADINLVGKTNLRQAAALVKAAACHVDNESGLVTIASCYGTPSCVVYGPSSADYFTYDGNATIRPLHCGGCWWVAKDWMSRCPRGMNQPICMYSQPPGNVAEAVVQLLAANERERSGQAG
jgi:ADP-heptose:LPS heptosyltransferase